MNQFPAEAPKLCGTLPHSQKGLFMARTKKGSTPTYRLHKQSRQAIVTLPDGSGGRKDYLLAPWGSEECKQEYARLIGEWQSNPHALPSGSAG